MSKSTNDNIKTKAITALSELINTYVQNNDSRGEKLAYWINDYVNILKFENRFNPRMNKKYKRGEILKVNLGYNVGSEEGGLHYCVVIDKNNPLSSNTITVVPLTSIKENKKYDNRFNVVIDSEIMNILYDKANEKYHKLERESEEICKDAIALNNDTYSKTYARLINELQNLERIIKELSRMKQGSVAIVSQITTISKIRILDPKRSSDVFSNVCLCSETLNKIDKKIKELYIK